MVIWFAKLFEMLFPDSYLPHQWADVRWDHIRVMVNNRFQDAHVQRRFAVDILLFQKQDLADMGFGWVDPDVIDYRAKHVEFNGHLDAAYSNLYKDQGIW